MTTLDAVEQLPEDILLEWPKPETITRIHSESLRDGKPALEERFYITTLPMTQAETMGLAARHHWGIENKLHWVLDVAFREDADRTRKGSGPECSVVLRHIARLSDGRFAWIPTQCREDLELITPSCSGSGRVA